MSSIVEELEAITGPGGVLSGDDVSSRASGIWRSDSIAAKAIVRPQTTEEVSQILCLSNEKEQSVIAHGGLTGLVESAITSPDDIALSFERMNQIEEINTTERTITVQSGTILQTVQEAAENAGLFYPLDVGGRGSCTIGGNIATNAGGNRVIRYGMARDMVLGLEAVLADGTIVSSMNHMIKNNAGYDLKQLFIGTEGSLGIVTRVVLRLREQPRSNETMLVAVDAFDKLPVLLKKLDGKLGGTLSAFEVLWNNYYRLVTTEPAKQRPPLDQDYPYYVLIEAMGGDPEKDKARVESALEEAFEAGLVEDAVLAQSEAQRNEMWAIRDDVEQTMRYEPCYVYDVSLRISDMENYVEQVNRNLAAKVGNYTNFAVGHMGDGNLHFAVSAGKDSSSHHDVNLCVYETLRAINGSVSAEHGVGLEKKAYLDFSRNESEVNLMRLLKRSLDPRGILNPGKIFDTQNSMSVNAA